MFGAMLSMQKTKSNKLGAKPKEIDPLETVRKSSNISGAFYAKKGAASIGSFGSFNPMHHLRQKEDPL
jgi:hypothetical protein